MSVLFSCICGRHQNPSEHDATDADTKHDKAGNPAGRTDFCRVGMIAHEVERDVYERSGECDPEAVGEVCFHNAENAGEARARKQPRCD